MGWRGEMVEKQQDTFFMQFSEFFAQDTWYIYASGVLVIGLLMVFSVFLWRRIRRKTTKELLGAGRWFRWRSSIYVESLASELTPNGYKHWKTLLGMSMGDAQRASRLVLYERKNAPDVRTDDLIEWAIDRYHRDNRP